MKKDGKKNKLRFLRSGEPNRSIVVRYLVPVVVISLVALICFPMAPVMGYHSVALVLLLTVTFLSLRLEWGPLLLAATLSALIWDFFFIPPHFTFTIDLPEDILMLGAYLIIALITGLFTTRIRAREERAVALYTLTRELSNARSLLEVIGVAISNIKLFFNSETVLYLQQRNGELVPIPQEATGLILTEEEFHIASQVYQTEKKAGRFTSQFPSARFTFYPLSGPRKPLGVIGIKLKGDKTLSPDQEILLGNFVSQIASAVERELLNDLAKRSIVIAESERLYKNLFNSISHELRIPISAILSASENLMDGTDSQRPDVWSELTNEIHKAAERLNRLIKNLLDMTRLESGLIKPNLDWCDVNDLIQATLKELKKELSGHAIRLDIKPELPLIRIDFGLIERVIFNVLYNAISYTPDQSEIQIQAYPDVDECVITISDNGPGFPAETLDRVFEKFYRVPGTRAGGTGLGLSIARGFVEAHHGTLVVENRKEGGARFTIRLPAEATRYQMIPKEI